MAIQTTQRIAAHILIELEMDIINILFTSKWTLEEELVIENLCLTFNDYFNDLRVWITSSFFFSKIVRECLEQYVVQ